MKSVLVFGMTETLGGVESFLKTYYEHINPEIIHFDFLTNALGPVAYEKELTARGAKVFYITPRSKNIFRYRKELWAFFMEHAGCYDAVWVNVCSLANIDYLTVAKRYGIKRRIIHSHNSGNMDSFIRGILHQINRYRIRRAATDYWACSLNAAKWFYSSDLLKKCQVIRNAFEIEHTVFSPAERQRVRNWLNCDNKYVIGNIGRMHFQKNQAFLLDILACCIKTERDIVLIMIGDGPDKTKLQEKAEKLGIMQYIIWAGVTKNIASWLSAFDLLLFPSRFEGTPYAVLEGQANGVPVMASSESVIRDCIINDNCFRFSLKHSAQEWSEHVLNDMRRVKRISGRQAAENMRDSDYNIDRSAKYLEALLMGTEDAKAFGK